MPTTSANWGITLDVDFLRNLDRIIDLDTAIAHGAFDLGMPEQELHGSEVTGAPVDKDSLRPAQGERAELSRIEPDAGNPLLYEPCELACCEASLAVSASRKKDLAWLPP